MTIRIIVRTDDAGMATNVGEAEPLRLLYRNWRGEVSERTITPSRVWYGSTGWHPEPGWLLTAYDHGKEAERDFAFSGFLSVDQAAEIERLRSTDGRWP